MVAQKYKKPFVVWWIGCAILVLGIVCVASYRALYQAILEVKLPLKKDSASFPLWKDIPTPLYFKAYFFNVTNPDAILSNNAVPVLNEVGPYTFRLYWNKNSIVFNSNFTITFRENSKYIFLRDESVGDLDDNVTTINGPMVIAGALVKNQALWKRVAVSVALDVFREKLFIKKNISDLLFAGYYDPITAIGRTFNPQLPDNKGYFSWFYGKNDTDDGLFVSFTGEDDMGKFNVIDLWNGTPSLNFWSAPSCNSINGSNAEISPPIQKNQETLDFFRTDLCRSWTLTAGKTVDHFGLEARQFSASSNVLSNSSVNPDNFCFEPNGEMPSGVVDISPCQYGAPVYLSQPHFFQGDPILRTNVNGMYPNESLHSFFLNIEPTSGITLTLGARTQVNIHLQKIPAISQFNNVPDIIFPVLWQEIVGEMPQNETEDLKHRLIFPVYVMSVTSLSLIGAGALVAIVSAISALYLHYYKRETPEALLSTCDDDKEPIIPGNEDDK